MENAQILSSTCERRAAVLWDVLQSSREGRAMRYRGLAFSPLMHASIMASLRAFSGDAFPDAAVSHSSAAVGNCDACIPRRVACGIAAAWKSELVMSQNIEFSARAHFSTESCPRFRAVVADAFASHGIIIAAPAPVRSMADIEELARDTQLELPCATPMSADQICIVTSITSRRPLTWKVPFVPRFVTPKSFHCSSGDIVMANMMRRDGAFAYHLSDRAHVLRLPLAEPGCALELVLMLPTGVRTAEQSAVESSDLIKEFCGCPLHQDALLLHRGTLLLPEFDMGGDVFLDMREYIISGSARKASVSASEARLQVPAVAAGESAREIIARRQEKVRSLVEKLKDAGGPRAASSMDVEDADDVRARTRTFFAAPGSGTCNEDARDEDGRARPLYDVDGMSAGYNNSLRVCGVAARCMLSFRRGGRADADVHPSDPAMIQGSMGTVAFDRPFAAVLVSRTHTLPVAAAVVHAPIHVNPDVFAKNEGRWREMSFRG